MTETRYSRYQRLKFDAPAERVLRIRMSNPGKLNATDQRMHGELGQIWRDIDADPDVSAVILTGEGDAFSAGGEMEMIDGIIEDFQIRAQTWKEARDLLGVDLFPSRNSISIESVGKGGPA